MLVSVATAAVGALLWMTVFPRLGTDLSAQLARAGWASRYPGTGYIFSWYGGVYPAAYSVLSPYLFGLVGVRPAMAVAAVVSAGLLAWLLVVNRVPRPRIAAVWAATAVLTELTAGRGSFTVGLATGLGCVAVVCCRRCPRRPRWLAIAFLALVTSLLSPVAGLFLGVPAVALLLTGRRAQGLVMGLGAALPLAVLGLLSRIGPQPIGWRTGVPSLLTAVSVLCLVPSRWRMVRVGAAVYGIAVLVTWAVPTPVGANVDRLAELLPGPLLAGMGSARHRLLLGFGLLTAIIYQCAQPVVDLSHGNAPPFAPQTAALVRELRALGADTARVEAVPQYGHWAAADIGSAFWLARGWERQTDIARNPLFYRARLAPAAYRAWLVSNAVSYVALCDCAPDWAATREAALVRSDPPWLEPVWHDARWRLYRVAGARPLVSPPGTALATTPGGMTLRMSRAGTAIVRVRWSPLLRGSGGAILAPHGTWVSITVARSGDYTLTAPY